MVRKYPVVDIGKCTLCGGCIEVAPNVFRFNKSLGIVEVVDLEKYPEIEVDEAIKNCPVDCIEWDEND